MDEKTQKAIASQLRQPDGEHGLQVGIKMNEGNLHINHNSIEALRLAAGDHVLEIGMGNGFFVKDILKVDPSIHYAGCDFSELMVSESKKMNAEFISAGRAEFHFASAHQLPYADNTFTKVFTVNTIYFWEDQAAVLAEFHRVLKPGGLIVIAVRPKSLMQHYPFTRFGFNLFGKNDLADVLRRNHFDVTEIIEKEEPPQEVGSQQVTVGTLIVTGTKS
jgi:ubiquinone/menaquinone biosynthesis C-methylase UbiE